MRALLPSPRSALAVVVVLALTWSAARAAHAAARIGAPAPSFALADGTGGTVRLADLRGRIVVIDFWASWCAPCAAIVPALDRVARRYPPTTVVVLAVGVDDDPRRADRFLAEHVPTPAFRVLRDRGAAALADFGAAGMPALYVVDAAGIVRLAEVGFAPDRVGEVERTIDALLAGSAAAPSR